MKVTEDLANWHQNVQHLKIALKMPTAQMESVCATKDTNETYPICKRLKYRPSKYLLMFSY